MACRLPIVISIVIVSLIIVFSALTLSKHHQRASTSPSPTPTLTPTPLRPAPPFSRRSTFVPVHQACNITRYPKTCEASMNGSDFVSSSSDPIQIVQFTTSIAFTHLKTAQSTIQSLLDSSSNNQNRSKVAQTCLEVLRNAEYRISLTNESLPRGKIKDARAWMSAALVYEYGCWSGLRTVNDTKPVVDTVSFMNSLIEMTSNALNMMVAYDVFGKEVGSWSQTKTERDGFWEGVVGSGNKSGLDFKGGFPMSLTANVTVCKGGGAADVCKYRTVQEAVNAAPDNDSKNQFVIRIREGVYEETVRVGMEKKNVVFLGDGMGKTVITGSLNVGQPGMTTYNTATVGVLGDGFMASGLTIENTAGSSAHQAVAFRSDSDLSIIENCEFIGNQDTLYANTLRQFYKSCRIQGNVDFIFGNSASVFQDCIILISPQASQNNNVITAHGRIDPAQSTGLVFQNCTITGNKEYMALYNKNPTMHSNFLGRPWKEYSRTVFINCKLGPLITPQGWMPWNGDFALQTLYYGEFENSGPGANLSARVPWSSQIPADRAYAYSVQNFLQGDEWIPTP